jgi:predicted flap endonuclease-1-like 5' DNA nuclease
MTWLQENWIIAVVGLVVAVVLLWWLFGRKRPDEAAPPAAMPAEPKKPLEAAKPDIVKAEPARFKPKEAASASPRPVPAAPPTASDIPAEPTVPPAPVAQAPEPEPAAPPPVAPAPPAEAAPAPAAAKADNLQFLKGVGPKMATLLGGLGVTSFAQIAAWTDADIAAIDPQLGAFQGRIARDNIVDQAGYLAKGDKAGFEAKYGALGGEL